MRPCPLSLHAEVQKPVSERIWARLNIKTASSQEGGIFEFDLWRVFLLSIFFFWGRHHLLFPAERWFRKISAKKSFRFRVFFFLLRLKLFRVGDSANGTSRNRNFWRATEKIRLFMIFFFWYSSLWFLSSSFSSLWHSPLCFSSSWWFS